MNNPDSYFGTFTPPVRGWPELPVHAIATPQAIAEASAVANDAIPSFDQQAELGSITVEEQPRTRDEQRGAHRGLVKLAAGIAAIVAVVCIAPAKTQTELNNPGMQIEQMDGNFRPGIQLPLNSSPVSRD